ncbi:MAG: T9SS type A sorting domain-containing protein [Reichenbachiella sp.]
MKNRILHVFILTVMGSAAMAQTVWNPAANANSTGDWSEVANWTNGLPNDANKAVFNVADAADATVTDTQAGFQLVQGDGGPGGTIIVADGGSVTTKAWAGIGHNDVGVLTVETGGVFNFGEHAWIGHIDGGDGTVNVNGGTVTIAGMLGLGWNGGVGKMTVSSGWLKGTGFGDASIKDGSSLEISSNANVKFAGDVVGNVKAEIEAGRIINIDGGAVGAYFDGDSTVIAAIPPPAGTTVWVGSVDSDWNTFANWSDLNVPTENSKVVFNVLEAGEAILEDPNNLDFQDTTKIKHLVMGDNGPMGENSPLIIGAGGHLETSKVWGAVAYNNIGYLEVLDGGQLTIGEHFWVALTPGSVAHVEHYGIINVKANFSLGWQPGTDELERGKSTYNLRGGLLNLDHIHDDRSFPEGSIMDITGGTMTIARNLTAHTDDDGVEQPDKLAPYIDLGTIVANAGFSDVVYFWDEEMAKTVVVAPGRVNATYPMDAAVLPEGKNDTTIHIEFSKPLDAESVAAALTVTPAIENMLLTWEGNVLTISGDPFTEGVQYTVTVTTDATDAYGVALEEELVFSFRSFGDFVTDLGSELNASDIFSVYPNPANNVISFSNDVSMVQIYNATGQLVLNKREVSSINISALNPGVYVVKASVEGAVETRRIIKQ